MSFFRKQIVIIIVLFAITCLANASDSTKVYSARIEGTIRGKYEYFTEVNEHRFQVRNARFSLKGNVSPYASYKAEIDLSDEGKTKMLDAYVMLQPKKWWSFTIGQQKVPFSTDNLRSPHNLYFANRSFMGKQLTNLRDVGISANFLNEKKLPVDLTIGIYNGLGLYTQDKTMTLNELSYAARLIVFPKNPLKISLNANTIQPSNIRMTFYNAGLMYDLGNFHIESEYLYKTYSENSLLDTKTTTGYVIFSAYKINTPKLKIVKNISPVLRYEGMTRNLKYDIQNSNSIATKIDEARNRVTGGLIISLAKPFINDIRLNYERYFWKDGTNADSKFVAEFVVHF